MQEILKKSIPQISLNELVSISSYHIQKKMSMHQALFVVLMMFEFMLMMVLSITKILGSQQDEDFVLSMRYFTNQMSTETMYYFILLLDSVVLAMAFSVAFSYAVLRRCADRAKKSTLFGAFVKVLGLTLILNQLIFISPFLQVLVEIFHRETTGRTFYFFLIA